jgi:hypothetical protein
VESSCLAGVRCLEIIKDGKASIPFMSFSDRIEVEVYDNLGHSIFGKNKSNRQKIRTIYLNLFGVKSN